MFTSSSVPGMWRLQPVRPLGNGNDARDGKQRQQTGSAQEYSTIVWCVLACYGRAWARGARERREHKARLREEDLVVMGFEPTALTFEYQPETRPTQSRQLLVDFRVYKST